jgi:putative phosphoribosyl transferase
VTRWLQAQPEARGLPVGFFGASTGAAAALWASADLGGQVGAVVSRGGRLGEVRAPTLLVVGGHDQLVLERNRQAQAQLRGLTILQVIAGAGHLFEEPGALDRVAALAAAWFRHQLSRTSPAGPGQTPRDPSEPSSRTDTVLQG